MRIFNITEKRACRRLRNGLTLVEVLIATAVLSLLLTGALTILNSSNSTWNVDTGLVELQRKTRQAMAGMVREVRQADFVAVDGSTITFSTPWAAAGNIVYSLNNNQIIRTYNGITSVLANNISSLNFVDNSSVVEIQTQAQKAVRGRTITFPVEGSLIEKVKLRN